MKQILSALTMLVLLAACEKAPESAFYSRGGPESLLDVSSEVVNLSVGGPNELSQLSAWINQDQPSRAELYCNGSDKRCSDARNLLAAHGVPTMMVPSGNYTVSLVYERILARDCNPRYTEESIGNNDNAPYRSFGCAMSANIVQHVSDKQEFVNPSITDPRRAGEAVTFYDAAMKPRPRQQPTGVDQSVIKSAKSD